MSKIFSGKHTWSEQDWVIYFSNLDILCRKNIIGRGGLAKKIGVANAYRKAKTRPNTKTITRICETFDVSEEWLGTDHGVYSDNIQSEIKVKHEKGAYRHHGDPPAVTVEDLTGIPKDHEMWRAYKLLHEIYESGDEVYIRAVFSNLVALNNAAQQNLEIQRNKQRLSDMERRLRPMDRRSAAERRKIISPNFPIDKERRRGGERRSGVDRRKTG